MHTPFTLWMNFSRVQMIRITDYMTFYMYPSLCIFVCLYVYMFEPLHPIVL